MGVTDDEGCDDVRGINDEKYSRRGDDVTGTEDVTEEDEEEDEDEEVVVVEAMVRVGVTGDEECERESRCE